MANDQAELAQEIENLRSQLIKLIGSGHGLNDDTVLKISKLLDELIVRYSSPDKASDTNRIDAPIIFQALDLLGANPRPVLHFAQRNVTGEYAPDSAFCFDNQRAICIDGRGHTNDRLIGCCNLYCTPQGGAS
jgi:hypothetical protein